MTRQMRLTLINTACRGFKDKQKNVIPRDTPPIGEVNNHFCKRRIANIYTSQYFYRLSETPKIQDLSLVPCYEHQKNAPRIISDCLSIALISRIHHKWNILYCRRTAYYFW